MKSVLIAACATLSLSASVTSAQSRIHDEFFDLNWQVWCPCQIKMKESPIVFPADESEAGDRFAQVTADDSSLGGNECDVSTECVPPGGTALFLEDFDAEAEADFDLPEPLGPSLVRVPSATLLEAPAKNPYCTPEVERRAKEAGEEDRCIQRQELRLQKALKHDVSQPWLYTFRIRMPAIIQDRKNSVRWVLAQWKHAPIAKSYCRDFDCDVWGPSPFLAVRFDDGVLHVTVQDEHCRCKVASAPAAHGSEPTWRDGRPQYCLSTDTRLPESTTCTADITVAYGDDPILSSPLGQWVELMFRIKLDKNRRSTIEIHEQDRFIAKLTGNIGYKPKRRAVSKAKFKIGQYRNYMPYVHKMDIDWVRIRPD